MSVIMLVALVVVFAGILTMRRNRRNARIHLGSADHKKENGTGA